MAIVWAPDFSTFIDTSKYPGAVWRPYQRAELDAPEQKAGFYTPRSRDTFGDYIGGELIQPFRGQADPFAEGGYSYTQQPTYQDFKEMGLWNPQDPNLQKHFDYLTQKQARHFGGVPDWRTNLLAANYIFNQMGVPTGIDYPGRATPEEAFAGVFTPEQIAQSEEARKLAWYQNNKGKHGGLGGALGFAGEFAEDVLKDFIIPSVATYAGVAGAAGLTGGAGAAAGGSASAGGTAAGTAAASEGAAWGAGLSGSADLAAMEAAVGLAPGSLGGATVLGGSMATPDWVTQLLSETGELGIDPAMLEGGFNAATSTAPWWSSLPTWGQNLVQNVSGLGSSVLDFLSGNASGGASRLLNGGGGMLDTAIATAPILAAINYARNQDPFDVSRLESTYDEFSPESLAFEYDQNTNRGRSALTSSLSNRGVMGSSFGNMDLTNFQTTRDLGRRSLVNQGLAQRGNIAASILDAKIKERGLKNDLYGRSLLALGNVFGGRNQAPVYA